MQTICGALRGSVMVPKLSKRRDGAHLHQSTRHRGLPRAWPAGETPDGDAFPADDPVFLPRPQGRPHAGDGEPLDPPKLPPGHAVAPSALKRRPARCRRLHDGLNGSARRAARRPSGASASRPCGDGSAGPAPAVAIRRGIVAASNGRAHRFSTAQNVSRCRAAAGTRSATNPLPAPPRPTCGAGNASARRGGLPRRFRCVSWCHAAVTKPSHTVGSRLSPIADP